MSVLYDNRRIATANTLFVTGDEHNASPTNLQKNRVASYAMPDLMSSGKPPLSLLQSQ
jgi:hypothetical protein